MKFRFLTSGESHGKCLNAIIEGIPSNFKIDEDFINNELKLRQKGIGRGGRMKIENDTIIINSGVRHGLTLGSPICLEIVNKDFKNWEVEMNTKLQEDCEEIKLKIQNKYISRVRPGHADLPGALKYNHKDIRNILERSSARETTIRTAVGAVAQLILQPFNISFQAETLEIGGVDFSEKEKLEKLINYTREKGDTLGGKFKITIKNVPVGLGSHVHWDKKLDALLAYSIMSIGGVKSVEFGLGHNVANTFGSKTHDEIYYENNRIKRNTNNAGGIEGGMSNGEDIIIYACMKAIPTMKTPLNSIDINTKNPVEAHFERSDVCAVESCALVAKNMAAIIIAQQFLEKFSGDSLYEITNNYYSYLEQIKL
ncbi:MAG: chorismate synthase [Candidatus Melainabacteria bacterium LEY3_CP_29_8]|nr:MAG: chorismate synthase [Candidatus Melainabacteria bacterium LEY3_CP_29_8]